MRWRGTARYNVTIIYIHIISYDRIKRLILVFIKSILAVIYVNKQVSETD